MSSSEFGDAYQGAREDMAIWKRRALESEAKVREQNQIIDRLASELNSENGPVRMGEPSIASLNSYTRGPWTHDGDGDIYAKDKSWIVCGHGGQRGVPNDADAELITAAPDLLEALEGLLPIAIEGDEYIPISASNEIDKALKAIARAKGESQ